MDKTFNILSSIPGFRGLSENQLEALRQIVVDRHFNKGEMIFSEGDEGNGFYVVADGKVKIFKSSIGGKKQGIIFPCRFQKVNWPVFLEPYRKLCREFSRK
ncbi:MAG: hypothetical protein SRB1_00269 [Desulfobacteraceae bacterium Eth-SRB1]|nr:MAG: hypothetical protein SRB1_00269 [Desulfobacteraceae bacterium Eth-SRB1]